jgi:hypothetical protein
MMNDKRPMAHSLCLCLRCNRMDNLLRKLAGWDACSKVQQGNCYLRKLAGTFRSTVKCLGSFFDKIGREYRMRFEV